MIPTESMDLWFTYHAPTEETAPKYRAVVDGQQACNVSIQAALLAPMGLIQAAEMDPQPHFKTINEACRAFADVINEHAPDSADKTAAIRCVRIARMAANEFLFLVTRKKTGELTDLDMEALQGFTSIVDAELHKARWLACSAIACG